MAYEQIISTLILFLAPYMVTTIYFDTNLLSTKQQIWKINRISTIYL